MQPKRIATLRDPALSIRTCCLYLAIRVGWVGYGLYKGSQGFRGCLWFGLSWVSGVGLLRQEYRLGFRALAVGVLELRDKPLRREKHWGLSAFRFERFEALSFWVRESGACWRFGELGVGCRIWGLGFGIWGLGFGVWV